MAGHKVPAEKESDAQLRAGDLQGDISISSDLPSEQINRPIQSITVEKFGQKVTQEQRTESPGTDVYSNMQILYIFIFTLNCTE